MKWISVLIVFDSYIQAFSQESLKGNLISLKLKRHQLTENTGTPAKTGEYLSDIFHNFQNCVCVVKNICGINTFKRFHLAQKLHTLRYLSLDIICSLRLIVSPELCSWKTTP